MGGFPNVFAFVFRHKTGQNRPSKSFALTLVPKVMLSWWKPGQGRTLSWGARYAYRAKSIKNKPRINEDPKVGMTRCAAVEVDEYALGWLGTLHPLKNINSQAGSKALRILIMNSAQGLGTSRLKQRFLLQKLLNTLDSILGINIPVPGRNDSRVPGGDPETQGAMISKQNEGCWGPGGLNVWKLVGNYVEIPNSRKSICLQDFPSFIFRLNTWGEFQ